MPSTINAYSTKMAAVCRGYTRTPLLGRIYEHLLSIESLIMNSNHSNEPKMYSNK